jgi:hypothetical protein
MHNRFKKTTFARFQLAENDLENRILSISMMIFKKNIKKL